MLSEHYNTNTLTLECFCMIQERRCLHVALYVIVVSTSRLFLSHGVSSSYMDFILTKPGLETTYTKLRFQGS